MRWLLLLAVLLLLILRFWPRGIWIAAAAAALLAGGVIWWEVRVESQLAQIRLEVAYAPAACPQGRPMQVRFTNNSGDELEKLLFSIHAGIPGYSSTVTPYTYKQYASEKILKPGEAHSACYEAPLLSRTAAAGRALGDLDWSAAANRAWFR